MTEIKYNEGQQAIKDMIDENLKLCTEAQQDLFKRMYPNGPRPDQLDWALTQVLKTVEKNKTSDMRSDDGIPQK